MERAKEAKAEAQALKATIKAQQAAAKAAKAAAKAAAITGQQTSKVRAGWCHQGVQLGCCVSLLS